MKAENPRSRVTAANNPVKETVTMHEDRRVGLKGPRVRWMERTKYEEKYGPAKESALRCHMIGGKSVCGVDYIHADAPSRHCY